MSRVTCDGDPDQDRVMSDDEQAAKLDPRDFGGGDEEMIAKESVFNTVVDLDKRGRTLFEQGKLRRSGETGSPGAQDGHGNAWRSRTADLGRAQ